MTEIKKIETRDVPAAVEPYSQGTVVSSGIGESVETETEVGDGVLEGRRDSREAILDDVHWAVMEKVVSLGIVGMEVEDMEMNKKWRFFK
jgi:hypothetical protein